MLNNILHKRNWNKAKDLYEKIVTLCQDKQITDEDAISGVGAALGFVIVNVSLNQNKSVKEVVELTNKWINAGINSTLNHTHIYNQSDEHKREKDRM